MPNKNKNVLDFSTIKHLGHVELAEHVVPIEFYGVGQNNYHARKNCCDDVIVYFQKYLH